MTMMADPPIARSPGISYQELLDTDTFPERVAPALREVNWSFLGDHDIPAERYTSRGFHDLEKEKLWKRVWQMACREEDLPEVGDTLVYDICDISILMVRSGPTTIQGFFNACLHRGRQLREFDGNCSGELRCPFHGYAWNLDGSLKHIPAGWDFPHVDPVDFSLPEVQVATWGGFVFINMDPNCQPFDEFVGVLPEHFRKWPLERRYKQAHVARVFRTNWKVVQEAFSEAFHVVATHPQLLPGIGDANSQYDFWGNVSRAITPNGTPSPHMTWAPTEQQMLDAMVDRRVDQPAFLTVEEGQNARMVAGEATRMQLRELIGDAADELSDAECVDSSYYTLFPNFHPWGSYNRIVYRFRPYGDNPEMSIMECMFLAPWPEGEAKPAAVPIHWLGPDDDWTEAPELGLLARVFNQDTFNLPKVQIGLHTLQQRKPGVTMAVYQETKLRHFHNHLTEWVARP
jgi:phenylpropionate dioxygenase-like ring-hydroxylating dioxygenase large terminal subunit